MKDLFNLLSLEPERFLLLQRMHHEKGDSTSLKNALFLSDRKERAEMFLRASVFVSLVTLCKPTASRLIRGLLCSLKHLARDGPNISYQTRENHPLKT